MTPNNPPGPTPGTAKPSVKISASHAVTVSPPGAVADPITAAHATAS